jgi:prolyl-tRNA editing enzyme YbaK/EbsC (Cys-tRNA(Pro) deacylase)
VTDAVSMCEPANARSYDERVNADNSASITALEHLVTSTLADVTEALGIASEVLPCDRDLADTVAFCNAYGYSLQDSANTIVVAAKSDPPRFAVCVALADTRLDVNGAIRRRLDARKASFASAGQTVELTGMEIGGVTPFGLPLGVPLWIDSAVMERHEVIVGGGSRSIKIRVAPAALAALPGAEVVTGLAHSAQTSTATANDR